MADSHLEETFAAAWAHRFPDLPFQREMEIPPYVDWAPERKLLGLAKRTCKPYRADFAWPCAAVAVEVQGGTWKAGGHSSGYGIQRDCEKAVVAQSGGWLLLPLTKQMLIKQQGIWLPRIARLIVQRKGGLDG